MPSFVQKAVLTSIDGSFKINPRVNGGSDLSFQGAGSSSSVQVYNGRITSSVPVSISTTTPTLVCKTPSSTFTWVSGSLYKVSIPLNLVWTSGPASAGYLQFSINAGVTGTSFGILNGFTYYIPFAPGTMTPVLEGVFKATASGTSELTVYAQKSATAPVGTISLTTINMGATATFNTPVTVTQLT